MSAPRKIWIRVTDGSLMLERPSDADEHDNLYHHDEVVRELIAALEEIKSLPRGEAGFCRPIADVALAKIAQDA